MMTSILIAQKPPAAANLATVQANTTALPASAITLTPTPQPTAVVRPQQTTPAQQRAEIIQPQIVTYTPVAVASAVPVQTQPARKGLSLTVSVSCTFSVIYLFHCILQMQFVVLHIL